MTPKTPHPPRSKQRAKSKAAEKQKAPPTRVNVMQPDSKHVNWENLRDRLKPLGRSADYVNWSRRAREMQFLQHERKNGGVQLPPSAVVTALDKHSVSPDGKRRRPIVSPGYGICIHPEVETRVAPSSFTATRAPLAAGDLYIVSAFYEGTEGPDDRWAAVCEPEEYLHLGWIRRKDHYELSSGEFKVLDEGSKSMRKSFVKSLQKRGD